MAEGFLRALGGDRFEAASAGTEATRVHPLAIRVMREVGIDLGGHNSKTFDQFLVQPWDYVVTVCDHAHESCPLFPGAARLVHRGFDDPPRLAAGARTEQEALDPYRRVRDEIRAFVESLPESLADGG